ncbi:kinesin-domain-containing protein [Violaceomyces palustris]|uniref:Kinesin-domain-containing protein n=1 Tax=Violaceomyces palustris TaxID=1673888 RepID=A0ACD0P0P5_9BASI|nr:kinesin-domain-containing protein [Violaceomyces palustris]
MFRAGLSPCHSQIGHPLHHLPRISSSGSLLACLITPTDIDDRNKLDRGRDDDQIDISSNINSDGNNNSDSNIGSHSNSNSNSNSISDSDSDSDSDSSSDSDSDDTHSGDSCNGRKSLSRKSGIPPPSFTRANENTHRLKDSDRVITYSEAKADPEEIRKGIARNPSGTGEGERGRRMTSSSLSTTSIVSSSVSSSSIQSSISETSVCSSQNTISQPSTPKKRQTKRAGKEDGHQPHGNHNQSKRSKTGISSSSSSSSRPHSPIKPIRNSQSNSSDLDRKDPSSNSTSRQNVVVCVRMRPSCPDPSGGEGEKVREEPIWSFDKESNRITPTEFHPALAKRVGSSSSSSSSSAATSNATNHGNGGSNLWTDSEEDSSTYDFRFDRLVQADEGTDSMYESHISPVVKASMEGYNGTVFAYGQTGSGKTHTMSGSKQEPGVIPRAVEQVFRSIQEDPSREFLLRVSYLEIYNETLRDLLSPVLTRSESNLRPASPTKGGSTHSSGSNQLRIVEDKGKVMITGLKEEIVTDSETVLGLIERGQAERHVGATDWNTRSSRSHCVFQLTIESREKLLADEVEKKGKEVRISQLNLIDLAGSERAASQAERRKEGSFINKSLLTLGTVIAKLTEPNGNEVHVPYRDSKLTRLLQTSLSGNARIAVICTLSPDVKHAVETLSTLKFGRRCKMVVTTAKKGSSMDDKALLQKYRRELDALRARLEAGGGHPQQEDHQGPNGMTGEKDSKRQNDERVKLEELNHQKEKAEKEVREMQERRSDLKSQIDHLTRLILTSQSVAQERRRVSASGDATNPATASPWKDRGGPLERRGPRMSDITFSISSRGSPSTRYGGVGLTRMEESTSSDIGVPYSCSKPFELETELASLKKELEKSVEERSRLISKHSEELALRDTKQAELEEAIRMNEAELDEAEIAYDKLKEEREEARMVALKEQEEARKARKLVEEEREASRLLKLVAKSREVRDVGGDAASDDREIKVLKEEIQALKTKMSEKQVEMDDKVKGLEEKLKRSLNDHAKVSKELESLRTPPSEEEEAEQEFKDLVSGANNLKSKEELEMDRRFEELNKREMELEERSKVLDEKEKSFKIKPLPVPQIPTSPSSSKVGMSGNLTPSKEEMQAQQEKMQRLVKENQEMIERSKEVEDRTLKRVSELEKRLEEKDVRVSDLERERQAERKKNESPIESRNISKGADQALLQPWKKKPFVGGAPMNRGGSMREYIKYRPSMDVFGGNEEKTHDGPSTQTGWKKDSIDDSKLYTNKSAETEEIARLNSVIQIQRSIMSDLEKSVASWKNRLKTQAELIQKLAGGIDISSGASSSSASSVVNITPPMQDYDPPLHHAGTIRTTESTDLNLASKDKFDSFRPNGNNLYGNSPSATSSPYYGAHTFNRPPPNVGLGVIGGSPKKLIHTFESGPKASNNSPCSIRDSPKLFGGMTSRYEDESGNNGGSVGLGVGVGFNQSLAERKTKMRKPRMTIENELAALKNSPKVESWKSKINNNNSSSSNADGSIGGGVDNNNSGSPNKFKTSSSAFYI